MKIEDLEIMIQELEAQNESLKMRIADLEAEVQASTPATDSDWYAIKLAVKELQDLHDAPAAKFEHFLRGV